MQACLVIEERRLNGELHLPSLYNMADQFSLEDMQLCQGNLLDKCEVMTELKLDFKEYFPSFIRCFGDKILVTDSDNKVVSIADLSSCSVLDKAKFNDFVHNVCLIDGKVLLSTFNGEIIDIYGLNNKNCTVQKMSAYSQIGGSLIYCMEPVPKYGLILIG